ncbi:hypothetical protein Q5752_005022 [Cryptotrichosporon argae]
MSTLADFPDDQLLIDPTSFEARGTRIIVPAQPLVKMTADGVVANSTWDFESGFIVTHLAKKGTVSEVDVRRLCDRNCPCVVRDCYKNHNAAASSDTDPLQLFVKQMLTTSKFPTDV